MEFAFVGSSTEMEWGTWQGTNVEADDTGRVQLAQELFPTYVTPTPVMGDMPSAFTAVDIDLDAYGTMFVLSGAGNLFRHDRERERTHHLPYPRLDEEAEGKPTALRVTGGILFITYSRRVSENGSESYAGSVQAIGLERLRQQWITKIITEDRRFERPSRIVEASHPRTVYILDKGSKTNGQTGVVVSVDTDGEVTPIIEGLNRPKDITVDQSGALYVLANDVRVDGDEPVPVIWRFEADDLRAAETEGPVSPTTTNKLIEVRFDGKPIGDRIEVVDEDELLVGVDPTTTETEAVLFRYLRAEDEESFKAERLTSFRRGCHRLLLARGRTGGRIRGLYVIDSEQRKIHFLPETRRYRRNKRTAEADQRSQSDYTARLVKRFDTGVAETRWHRVRLELDRVDPNTGVSVRYYATDEQLEIGDVKGIRGIGPVYAGQLRDAGITDISALVRRDPEGIANAINATRVNTRRTRRWSDRASRQFEDWWRDNSRTLPGSNPRDALLEATAGRYLWVSLELTGSEFSSPRLDSLRAYFPKQSYLRYLPAIYQEDARSAAFLERFLSIFETMFVDIEDEIEGVTQLLDAGGAPEPYLSWLQRWIAVETDETWPKAARREFLSNAPTLFKTRGTRSGLLELIRIYLEVDNHWSVNDGTRLRTSTYADLDKKTTGEITGGALEESAHHRSVGPYILEHLDLDGIDDSNTRKLYERFVDCPQCFLVLLGIAVSDEQTRTVQRILESERPAHTTGRAVKLRPMTQLGSHTYLGLNTVLSREEFVLGRTGLGEGSMLTNWEHNHRTNT